MNVKNRIILSPPIKSRSSKVLKLINNYNHINWVYLGENVINAIDIEKWIGKKGEQIDIASRLQETAHLFRSKYIDYVGELNNGSANWWATTISEKNPFISTVLLHICYLQICKELLEKNQFTHLVIFVENGALRKAIIKNFADLYKIENADNRLHDLTNAIKDKIKNILQKIYYISKNIYIIIIIKYYKLNRHRYSCLEKKPLIILRDWIDYRSFDSKGQYKSAYFGNLNKELKLGKKHFVILPYIININKKILEQIINSNEPFIIPHVYLTEINILSKFFINLSVLESYPFFNDLDITYLIQDDFKKDTVRFIDALLYTDLMRNLSNSNISFQSCIYLYENYIDEKLLCAGIKKYYPLTKLFGYQHSTAPIMLLSYFFSKKEYDSMPFPDKIITNGQYFTNLFKEEGYPSEKVATGAAIRYGYLYSKERIKYIREQNKSIYTILVTPSASFNETLELLKNIIQAFGDKKQYKIIIKYHPALNTKALKKYIGQLPSNTSISEKPVPELLNNTDLLIYNFTGACLEALYVGVPILHVKSNYRIDLDIFDYKRTNIYSAKNVEEIIHMGDELLQMNEEQLKPKQDLWKKVVEDMFRPVDESTYKLLMDANG
ncbi:Uncharacterised protein [uncultured archaeon]|nr:Uncharacterised protein [uncultured archaeon]